MIRILLCITLTFTGIMTTAFADERLQAITLGTLISDKSSDGTYAGADIKTENGLIATLEVGYKSLMDGYNPYVAGGSYQSTVRGVGFHANGEVQTVSIGVSIPTKILFKVRVGLSANEYGGVYNKYYDFLDYSTREYGLDLGIFGITENGIAITGGYNTELKAFNIGAGFGW